MNRLVRDYSLTPLLCAWLVSTTAAHPGTRHAHDHTRPDDDLLARADDGPVCKLTLALVDQTTGQALPGLVRVTTAAGEPVPLAELLNRGTMLAAEHAARQWHVVVEPTAVTVPRTMLVVEAFAGLETEMSRREFDATDLEDAELRVPLVRFVDAAAAGWRSGNTHLHLMNMTRAQADRYLRTIPRGDDLELVFLSYLRRVDADKDYISNSYTKDDLRGLESDELRFGNGEEHRHNFDSHGEGYGHVMLLDIDELVEPVSIGPGIMGTGTDGPPLARGIRRAHDDQATVVWCHNDYGLEDVPNWMAGSLDAQNIFDGSAHRDYGRTFYRYLNIGLRVPFSTGTDWFLYDFSRAYVRLEDELTVESWLGALASGRSFITNGPLFEFTVDGHAPGDVIELSAPAELPLTGRAVGRHDFGRLEVVHNGRIASTSPSRAVRGHFEAEIDTPLAVDGPGWVALRIDTDAKNELGGQLFGHTSAVYIDVGGKAIFRAEDALGLLEEMEQAIATIIQQAKFADDAEQNEVLEVYRAGIMTLRTRLDRE